MEKEEDEILDLLDLCCAQALQVIKTRTMQYSIRHSKEMGGDGFLASHSGSNFDRINPLKLGMESQITNYKLLFDPKVWLVSKGSSQGKRQERSMAHCRPASCQVAFMGGPLSL